MNGHRNGDWVQTFSGQKFWPCDPLDSEIHIVDVAHHLSLLCRFTGATRAFYSVAQHSTLCSRIVPAADAKWGLLHDASEAYLADIARPVKPFLSNYRALERALMVEVAVRFHLPWPMPPAIHHADDVLALTERRDLLNPGPEWGDWTKGLWLLEEAIVPLAPAAAEREFLARYEELFAEEAV
jgi:5'-deoxynucleotidase YfbR-like HD superfamily hydrolase